MTETETTNPATGKRTGIDWSKHELHVKVTNDLLVHDLRIGDSPTQRVKFINTNGIMVVTGDFCNWVFCREFHPSADGYTSGMYWVEKAESYSSQDVMEWDKEATEKSLKEKIEEHKYECKEAGIDVNEQLIEYYEGCLERVHDNILDYEYFAYRELPSKMDYEDVIFEKDYKHWFKIVLDAFDEICRRMKVEQDELEKQEEK